MRYGYLQLLLQSGPDRQTDRQTDGQTDVRRATAKTAFTQYSGRAVKRRRHFVEESINESISVDLGVCNPGAIGNSDLVVAVQR